MKVVIDKPIESIHIENITDCHVIVLCKNNKPVYKLHQLDGSWYWIYLNYSKYTFNSEHYSSIESAIKNALQIGGYDYSVHAFTSINELFNFVQYNKE